MAKDNSPQGLELHPKPRVFGMSRKPLALALILGGIMFFAYLVSMVNKDNATETSASRGFSVDRASAPVVKTQEGQNQGIIQQDDLENTNRSFELDQTPAAPEESGDIKIVTVHIPAPEENLDLQEEFQELTDIRRAQMTAYQSAISSPMRTAAQVQLAVSDGYGAAAYSPDFTSSSSFSALPTSLTTRTGQIDADQLTAHMRGNVPADMSGMMAAAGGGSGLGGGVDFFGSSSGSGMTSATDQSWNLGFERQAGHRFELKTGSMIPGILISGINSDLSGSVMAQVGQNVYDSTTGRHLLIPQGSRLYGDYAGEVKFGQERLYVSWKRVIFPDGSSLTLGDMRGSDQQGYSGLNGNVNNHYFQTFGSAILMSAITGGVTYSVDALNRSNSDSENSVQNELSIALGQQLGQVGMNLMQKYINVAPTIEIEPGYRFSIVVTKDIIFANPYAPMAAIGGKNE
ncbi:MAG: hypothetical protein LBV80_11530 [Deltaproteobacteria bacterium]|jgi:type IV secretion system protein VirB10|nr:hypothetical protein [Deltaproteobacteria bacterium]